MKFVLALVAALMFVGPTAAQHAHGNQKGPNGGLMEDVAGVHAELLVSGNTVTVNVFDEANKSMSTKGFSGSVLVVVGGNRETITLQPSGENALKGEVKKTIGRGAAVTLLLKTAAGKSGQARFKL